MKFLASDFDSTLYFNEQPAFRPRDLEAIQRFQAAGNRFGICTGRNLGSILDATRGLINFDFFIVNNGSVVLDGQQQVLQQNDVPTSIATQVMAHFSQFASFAMTDDKIYLYHNPQGWASPIARHINSLSEIQEPSVHNFSFHLDSPAATKKLTDEINALGLPIQAFQNVVDIDCVRAETSKGSALAFMQQHYQIAPTDLACIGDSYNDLPMLNYSQESFTFNSSPASVRAAATHSVDSLYQAVDYLLNAGQAVAE